MQKPLAILAILSLLAVAVFVATRGGGAPSPAADPARSTPDEAAPTSTATTGAVDATATPITAPTPDAAVPARTELAPIPVDATSHARGPALLVRDASTREAVAGADVRVLQLGALDAAGRAQLAALRGVGAGFLSAFERFAQALATDRRGEVDLPVLASETVVMARAGERRGVLRLAAGATGEHVLELRARRPLRVLVVGHGDTPVRDVPLEIAVRRDGRPRTVWSGVSDAQGRAAIDSAADVVALLAPAGSTADPTAGSAAATSAAELRARLPLRDALRTEVDLDAPPADEVVLRLPPLGRVVVQLAHARPDLLDTASVTLVDRDAGPEHDSDVSIAPRVEQARAVFEHVGLGLRLRATARLGGSSDTWDLDFDGPLTPGQTSTVRLELVEKHPIVVAVVRDEHGELVRSQTLTTRLHAERAGSSSSSFSGTETDREARLRMPIQDDLGNDATRTLQLDHQDGRTIKVTLPPLVAGENDLGELVLRAAGALCSGIVQDRAGAPIAGAVVEIERKVVYDATRADGFYWHDADIADVKSGDDGRFTVAGHAAGEELAVSVRCKGWLPRAREPFAPGTAGLVFVLDAAARLNGRVAAEGFDLHRRVDVEVHGADGVRHSTPARSDGGFGFDELAPGLVEVRVMLFGDPQPLIVRERVALRSGETTTLDDLGVTSSLRAVAFAVVDADGRAVDDAVALFANRADAQQCGGLYLERGRATALVREGPLDLLVYAEGFRNAHVADVKDGQRIALLPDLRVRLTLAGGATPPAGFELHARLEPLAAPVVASKRFRVVGPSRSSSFSGSSPWLSGASGVVDGAGAVLLRVGDPGVFRVVWSIGRIGQHPSTGLGADSEETVTVAERDGVQELTSRVTRAVIDAAVATMR